MNASDEFQPALTAKATFTHPTIRLTTPEAFLRYVIEQQAWLVGFLDKPIGVAENIATSMHRQLVNAAQGKINQVQGLINSNADQGAFQEAFDQYVRQLEERELLHSHSRMGRYLHDLAPENSWQAIRVAASYSNLGFNLGQTDRGNLWARAAATALLVEKGLFDKAPNLDGPLIDLSTNWNAQFSQIVGEQQESLLQQETILQDLRQKLADVMAEIGAFHSRSTDVIADGVSKLEAVRETYKTELTLHAPTTYWRTKQVNHMAAAAAWGAGFLGVAGGGGYFVWHVWTMTVEPILSAITAKGGPDVASPSYGLFLPTVAAAFLVVWVLRIASGQLLANFTLSAQAEERVAMVKTFLSLMQKPEHVKDGDRILILSALFRPAQLSHEDATPPNWFDLLMQRVSKKD